MRARSETIGVGFGRDGARRARAALSAVVLAGCAGCFSDRGLAVEIAVGDTGATRVELHVGASCEDHAQIDCEAIAPPDGTVTLGGTVWLRNDPEPYIAEVKDGTATFRLRSDKAQTSVLLVATGLVGDNRTQPVGAATLRDVVIPTDGARVATATLVPAAPVLPAATDGRRDGHYVLAWETLPSRCLVVEHWDGGAFARDFVVPADDPDCDRAEPECNPTAFMSASPPEEAPPDCFTRSGSQACVLGSRGCVDGQGPGTGTCVAQPERVCVPSGFCDCPEPVLDGGCVPDLLVQPDDLPRVVCNVPANQTATGLAPCSDLASAPLDLSPRTGSAECDQPLLGSLQLSDAGTSHGFGGATLELSSPSPACTTEVSWKGGTRTAVAPSDHGYVRVPFADHALVLPLIVTFTPGCVGPFTCEVVGLPDDTLWSCGQ